MKTVILLAIAIVFNVFVVTTTSAHCDTYGGPVVNASQRALETQNINNVLIWIKKKDEREIEEAFRNALKVRVLSPEAKALADKSFFETVVRVHRAGEGAPYTGLKPADQDLGPAIPAADKAIETKDLKKLNTLLTEEIHAALHTYFEDMMTKKRFDVDEVEKGREFVTADVEFIHFV